MSAFGRREAGPEGERLAADFLKTLGYKVLRRNCRSLLGEIDLIMRDGDAVVFVEVKSRSSATWGDPEHAVTRGKQRKICRQAVLFADRHKLRGHPLRFDVVTVLLEDDTAPVFKHFENAFTLQ